MDLFVKSPTGTIIRLKVHPSDTLYTVKAKIQQQHRLFFEGVQLEDNLTLADYGIEHRSMLDLEERMQIYVTETLAGRTFTLQVDSLDTIDKVKAKIEDDEGFPKDDLCSQAAGGRPHLGRPQHLEGVHSSPCPPPGYKR